MASEFSSDSFFYHADAADSDDPGELPELDRSDALEASIRARLAEAAESARANTGGLHSRGVRPALYETRLLRSGAFRHRPMQVHARRRLSRESGLYYSPDQIAHILTSAAPDLPVGFLESVDQILLLPELAMSDRRLLTHIYVPAERLLAFYLYPLRLDRTPAPRERARIRTPSPLRRFGLLGRVLDSAAAAGEDPALLPVAAGVGNRGNAASEGVPTPPLHKFIIPRDLLLDGEAEALQRIHDLYAEERLL